jgi:hypothetical protein
LFTGFTAGLWVDVEKDGLSARMAKSDCISCGLVHNWVRAAIFEPLGKSPGKDLALQAWSTTVLFLENFIAI